TIRIDDTGIARKATNHLLGLGHTTIAHITGHDAYDQDFQLPGTRRGGVEKAMNDAGCPVRPEWIVSADCASEGAYAAARQLLASSPERPTA
ncbi:substrate-binding domain-containing protein, partial [Paenarthrobacter aurescens]|uniref:substrate-binding domain-containing protein n=1 Tax=Paenarthrobacter aurescens TaxID=43663 RepID=UPI0021C053DB